MKKVLFYLCTVLLLIANASAFTIHNSQNQSQTYFSLNENHVFVKSTTNSSLNVTYTILEETKYQTFLFEECGNEYCLNFYLSDLIESNQGSFTSSDYFELTQNDITKKIYLDFESPNLEVTNTEINSENKQLTLQYNFSDDSNQISKINFYEKDDNNNLNFIKEISKQTSITHDITEAKEYNFIFKIYDAAGNFKEIEKNVKVNDIFPPKIEKAFIIKNANNYQVEFHLTDKNLTKYEISQNSLRLSEEINNQQTYEKTVNIPFTTGDITLKAIDGQGNEATKKLSLKSPITHTYRNKYSSSKTFSFKSNADMCYILYVDNQKYNKEMDEKSNQFDIKLDINTIKEYTIKYYCKKSNYKEYFESKFYYDTNKPTKPEITSKQLDNGFIRLVWTESKDDESVVDYILYRDNDKIYEGSKKEFEDDETIYPNSYEYYIKAQDEAGNEQESQKITTSPKKVKVNFATTLQDNLRVQNELLKFNFNTDKNSNIIINVKKDGEIIDSQNIMNTTTENQDFNLKLAPGTNQIEVNINDNLGNELKKTYFVTYNEPLNNEAIQNEIISEPQEDTSVIENPQNETTQTTQADEEKEGNNNWIWFVILLIIFVYFLWFFVFNEEKRKKTMSIISNKKSKNSNKNKSKKNKSPTINFSLSKDKRLEKDFNRIKKERIQRQEERKKDELRAKKLEVRQSKTTQLQKDKLEDLKNRREINIPMQTREKAKSTHKRIKKETTYEEELNPTKEQTQNKRKPFWSRKKEPQKNDEFSRYIQKVKSAPSWKNPRDYIHKEPEPTPHPKPEPTPQPKPEIPNETHKHTKEQTQNHAPQKQEESKQQKPHKEKLNLDSYLNKRKKSRRFFFAERSVNKDINSRK